MYKSLREGLALLLLLTGAGLRAQLTEVPDTVAPGRFLLEMDALSLSVDRDAGTKYTVFGAATTFLTTGLTSNLDLQVGAEVFISQKVETSGFTDRRSGVGNVYLRTKWRFYDEEGTAVAIMPYVKLPTSSGGRGNEAVEGGVIVPWSTKLPTGFEFAAMAELDFLRNAADDGYDTYWCASAYLSRPLTRFLGIYGELAAGQSSGGEPFAGTMGVGVTFAPTERVSWDYAIYKGLSKGAADWNHVLRLNIGF